jgi:hypothetical protein
MTPKCTTDEDSGETRTLHAEVYGLRRRETAVSVVRALWDQLAIIPLTVFTVGKSRRDLGVLFADSDKMMHVRVRRWSLEGAPPVIEWTLEPSVWGARTASRATAAMVRHVSAPRPRLHTVQLAVTRRAIPEHIGS